MNDPYARRVGGLAAPAGLGATPASPSARPRHTLGMGYFTEGAARQVSLGGALPGLDIHPWVVVQLRERTGIGPGGRPPTWTISRVRGMDTAAIQATLAKFGVQVDQLALVEAANERVSAWDLALDWLDSGADAELLGLAACELWRRWVPKVPSLEMIDERMQEGYDALESGDHHRACVTWVDVWGLLLDALPEERSVEALDEAFCTALSPVRNWVGDVSIELCNIVRKEPLLGRRARAVYQVAVERLGDRHLRLDLAELHYGLGETAQGEAVYEALIRDDPDDPAGYARLSDQLGSRWANPEYRDVPRAIALLEHALARPVRDALSWDLAARLEDLRKRPRAG